MNRFSGRLVLSLLTAAMSLTSVACGGTRSWQNRSVMTKTEAGTFKSSPASEVAARKNALARFVHAVPGLASVALFANDGKSFAGVAYKSVTAYRELPSAGGVFRLRLSSDSGSAAWPQGQEYGR